MSNDNRQALADRLRQRGSDLRSHPVANSTIDCIEEVGELLIEAADALAAQPAADWVCEAQFDHETRIIKGTFAPAPEPSAQGEPVNKWEGAEEWMPLAWELCADECGEESCTELVWEGGPIPEPWGDRWLKYEDEAKRLIALVRKHVPAASAPSTQPHAVVEAVPLTDEQADALRRLWPAIEKAMGCLVFTAEQAGAVQADMNTVRHGIAHKAAQP